MKKSRIIAVLLALGLVALLIKREDAADLDDALVDEVGTAKEEDEVPDAHGMRVGPKGDEEQRVDQMDKV